MKEKIKEWLEDKKYDISHIYKDFISFFRNLKTGIKNIIYYIPIIYKDRQWDFYYMHSFEYKKLKRMRDYFMTSNIVVNSKRYAQEIDLAIRLLEIIMEDDKAYRDYLDLNYSGPINFNKPYNDAEHKLPIYVNIHNIGKYMVKYTKADIRKFKRSIKGKERLYAMEIRKIKAKYLYYRLLYEHSEDWWD